MLELPRDLETFRLITYPYNLKLLSLIKENSNHSMRAIAKAIGGSKEKPRQHIKTLIEAGILKVKTKGSGRRAAVYKIIKGQEILRAMVEE